jgi:hypothetical protein
MLGIKTSELRPFVKKSITALSLLRYLAGKLFSP